MYIGNCPVCGKMVVYASLEESFGSDDCPHCRRDAERYCREWDKKLAKMFLAMTEIPDECALQKWARNTLTFDKDYKITLYSSTFNYNDENRGTLAKDFKVIVNSENDEIICFIGNARYSFAKYYSVKNFKAAIYKLKEAIERGDRSFSFPSDFDLINFRRELI